jgi:deoxyribodipyrimidine photo-lyase
MKTLFWFRRDLRLYGNDALSEALKLGATDALFFISKAQWQKHDTAEIQIDLLLRRVDYLGALLAKYGVKLHVIEADTFENQSRILVELCEQHCFTQILANAEYEINERNRDAIIEQALSLVQKKLTLFHGDVIAPPGTIRTGSGDMFKVFTPFKKAWIKTYADYHALFQTPLLVDSEIEWRTPKELNSTGLSAKWPVDDDALISVVERFIDEKLEHYAECRDFPAVKGTSGLSPYFALGIVSVKQVLSQIQQRIPDILHRSGRPEFSWINELIWREFYRHLIVEWPHLCKHQNFNSKYDHVPWRQDPEGFAKWCEGQTGYPLVDAAMRQLNETGWMHNRLRMVVASFLTKHLLIDWRKGEKYFMSKLIDGDLASNNGGWQWAASTGCDAQPYFRVFNPITQSEKFDPKGEFIRKFVPELKGVPDKYIHFPHDYLLLRSDIDYPKAIVDHKSARERALQAFKAQ